MLINDILFKNIWAGRRDKILTSVAHMRKRLGFGGEAGVSLLVCTQGAAFEMDWWKVLGVSVDTTILHTFLICLKLMVFSKECL